MSRLSSNKIINNIHSETKFFICVIIISFCTFNMCLSISGDDDISSTQFGSFPSLSDICSQSDLGTHYTDYDASMIDQHTSTPEIKNDTNILPGLLQSNLNQTLDQLLLLCIDHLSKSSDNETKIENSDPDSKNQNKLLHTTKRSKNMEPFDQITDDMYFDPTEEMLSDPEWLQMLKEFDILSEVVKNKSNLLEDELTFDYTDPSTLGNNTFLKSAITLYDTFINHYNMTGIQVHHIPNGTFHPFDDMDENDNGILFHHKSILSSTNR